LYTISAARRSAVLCRAPDRRLTSSLARQRHDLLLLLLLLVFTPNGRALQSISLAQIPHRSNRPAVF